MCFTNGELKWYFTLKDKNISKTVLKTQIISHTYRKSPRTGSGMAEGHWNIWELQKCSH